MIITIGKWDIDVAIAADKQNDHVLVFTATFGDARLERREHCQCPHDHPEEQYQKDIEAGAQRVARELSGRLRSAELRAKFLNAPK